MTAALDLAPHLRTARRALLYLVVGLGQGLTYLIVLGGGLVLGVVLALLKSDNATGANAQIYTPDPIADAMSYMLLAGINPAREGQSVMDPAVGTGGLFRAAAQVMRSNGQDPATVSWYGADIDDLVTRLRAWNDSGVGVFVRFAHEMNGSWYAWGQQPTAYAAAFRRVAAAVRAARS